MTVKKLYNQTFGFPIEDKYVPSNSTANVASKKGGKIFK